MKQAVTAKVKVKDSSGILKDTLETYSSAVQECIDRGWKEVNSRRELHNLTYYKIREEFDLYADLTTHIISQAWEMIKKSRSKPEVRNSSIRYNFPRSASIKGDWEELSLQTTEGRKKFSINIPRCYEQYLDWNVRESILTEDRGLIFFCFTFSKEVSIEVGCDSKILGVDLGVNKLAVTSDGDFFGTEARGKRVEWERLRSEIQRKGTHRAHKRLGAMGKRFQRYMTWRNHNISWKIVDKLEEGDVIVMEDLSYIRKRASYNEWVHKWPFKQLQQFIQYKATLKGIRVVYINPRNTSKRCSRCSSLQTSRKGSWFECEHCGYTLDADLNASLNIAHSYMETLGERVACKPAHDLGTDECERNLVAA